MRSKKLPDGVPELAMLVLGFGIGFSAGFDWVGREARTGLVGFESEAARPLLAVEALL